MTDPNRPEPNPFESPATIGQSKADHEGFLRYYVRVWPYFIAMLILTAVVDLVVVAVSCLPWHRDMWLEAISMYSGMILVTAIFHGALSAVLKQYYPVYISDEGLRCFDFWGKYRFVEWPTVTEVSRISMLGLEYLRVSDGSANRPLWLPLFISNQDEFWKNVNDYAPESPVWKWRLKRAETERQRDP